MDEQIETLRSRIDEITRGTDGRRVFTAAIRKDTIELANRWKASGRQLTALAATLNLHKTTLTSWLGRPKSKRPRVRSVRVEAERAPRRSTAATTTTIVAVLPSGLRIEGLAIGEAIDLASALR